MPITEANVKVYKYALGQRGLNYYNSIIDLKEGEALLLKNCFYRNGLIRRKGYEKLTTNQVVSSKKIVGLYPFITSTLKYIIVACDTNISYYTAPTWTTIDTARTTGKQTYFTNWLQSVYVANGTDVPFKWDGTTKTNITAAPSQTIQFLPYQDRLLSISNNSLGQLNWSASFSDTSWETVANCGVKPDSTLYGMISHNINNSTVGYDAKILLLGENGLYLFSGSDLRVPYTIGNYKIQQLAIPYGCDAPKTVCWTPIGTIFLAKDKQVYLLTFDSITPIPIGNKITNKNISSTKGLENIHTTANCSAIYHDNFYKLSIDVGDGIYHQYWLDVSNLRKDEYNNVDGWCGPMTGMTNSCFCLHPSTYVLLGGEALDATGGFVYNLNTGNSDNATAFEMIYQGYYNNIGEESVAKTIEHIEIEGLNMLSALNISFHDLNTQYFNFALTLSSLANYWNDYYWGETYWSDLKVVRVKSNISPTVKIRKLSVMLTNTNSTEGVEINNFLVEVKEQSQIFEQP